MAETFVGWGPFESGISGGEMQARLARLGPVVHAQGWDYADLAAAVRLAAASPRALAGLPSRFDALPLVTQAAIKAGYARAA